MQSGSTRSGSISKVPQVTLGFWIIKLLATTVGETGGDALSMTLGLGYGIASLIYVAFFGLTLATQIASKRYHPLAYWAVVVATTTVGTTVSDYLDRTAGLGYVESSLLLLCGVLAILAIWRRVTGRIEFQNIATRTQEVFYWLTIVVSNTLGTALGDFVATTTGLGFEGGALVFGGLLALVAAAHRWLQIIPASGLFWTAYVLTRPLGATLGGHPHQTPRRRGSRAGPHRRLADHRGAHDRRDRVDLPQEAAPRPAVHPGLIQDFSPSPL